jgi:hypothetical protein
MTENNPALTAFVAGLGAELVFGQVWICRQEAGFELRHIIDKASEAGALRLLAGNELRALAQFTATGAFRPLRSAPNLQRGWRATPRDQARLGLALNQLYPGAVADWFAARGSNPPVTSYRDFTNRQTGMYRITTHLDDATAGAMIRACCHKDFCLKRRGWTVEGLEPDAAAEKSVIPCLEPCAILLEFARKVARLEQEKTPQPAPDAAPLQNPDPSIAESDFDAPNNPRRVRFVLEKQGSSD